MMNTNADILAYLSAQGIQNATIHEVNPTVIVCVDTTVELSNAQKKHIRDNLPMYAHCDFCVAE